MYLFCFIFQSVNSSLNISDFLFCPNSCRKILLDGCLSYRDRRPGFACNFSTLGVLFISSSKNISELQTQISQILVSGPDWGYCRVKHLMSCRNDRTFLRRCSTMLTKGFSRADISCTEHREWRDSRMYFSPTGIWTCKLRSLFQPHQNSNSYCIWKQKGSEEENSSLFSRQRQPQQQSLADDNWYYKKRQFPWSPQC